MEWEQADKIRKILQQLTPQEMKEVQRAIILLDKSLSVTIGENWLDRVTGHNAPYDIRSVLTKNLVPDERGVLKNG